MADAGGGALLGDCPADAAVLPEAAPDEEPSSFA
jgi:hypothetical protein